MDETFLLRDGSRLKIRPILPEDAQRLHDLLGRLSLHTVCDRFLVVRRSLRDEEARRLATVDYRTRMALVALDARNVVAVARYDVEPGKPWTAEAAVVVEDRYQGRGLGTYLCRRLVDHARTNGVSIFTASVYASNQRMLGMIQRSGYPVSRRVRSGVVELAVDLVF
jgi:GNAT superfamily N-acetyltransferase